MTSTFSQSEMRWSWTSAGKKCLRGVEGAGFRAQGSRSVFRVQGLGFRVEGLGLRVQGLGCRVEEGGFKVWG